MFRQLLMEYIADIQPEDGKKIYKFLAPCGDYEEKYNKPIAEFTKEEVIAMLQSFGYKESSSLYIVQNIKAFLEWQGSYDSVYGNIGINDIREALRTQQLEDLITREELDRLLKSANNPRDQFLLYGLFWGIGGTDFVEITLAEIEDINTQKMIMDIFRCADGKRVYNRTIPVDHTLIQYAQKSNEIIRATGKSGRGQRWYTHGGIIKYSVNTDNSLALEDIIKKRKNAIRDLLKKYQKESGLPVSATTLRLSGFIYRLKSILTYKGMSEKEIFDTQEWQELLKNYGYKNIIKDTIKRYLDC